MKVTLMLMLCWSVAASAAVYKWVDSAGNVSYSDTPPPGGEAKVMDLPESSRYAPRELPKSGDANQPSAEPTTAPPVAYQRFSITKPGRAATVHSAEGLVPVELAIEPPLSDDHFVAFKLDGVSIGDRMQTNSFTMRGVERGTHSLQALLIDASGKQLAKPATARFTLRQDTLFTRPQTQDPDNPDNGPDGPSGQPPGAGNSSATPGRTNPAFAPTYTP